MGVGRAVGDVVVARLQLHSEGAFEVQGLCVVCSYMLSAGVCAHATALVEAATLGLGGWV